MTTPRHKTPSPAPAPDLLFGRLAVKAGYLAEAQVQDLLREQQELSRAGASVTFGQMCQGRKLMTAQQVDRLLLAQRYTEMREEDKRIGVIAVKNGFASEEEVQLALAEQVTLYRTEKALPKRLGELLVEAEVLTPQQLAALLSAQARIRQRPDAPGTTPPSPAQASTPPANDATRMGDVPTPMTDDDELEGEVVDGGQGPGAGDPCAEGEIQGEVVSTEADLEGEVEAPTSSPEEEMEGDVIAGEVETPPTKTTSAGGGRRSRLPLPSRARFQRPPSARGTPPGVPGRGGKKTVVVAAVVALAVGGWLLKDKWLSKGTATGAAGEGHADRPESSPGVGADAERPPQKAASEEPVDVAKLKMPPPSEMAKIDVDRLLPLPKVDPPDVAARLEEMRKAWSKSPSPAKKVYTCVGCQKKVTGTPGTTAKCPYCAKLLKFPVESTFSSSPFSEVEQRLLEMEARDIEKRWQEAVKSGTHAWVFKPFRTQHGVPNREWETVADLFDKLNEDVKRYLAPDEMQRRDALAAALKDMNNAVEMWNAYMDSMYAGKTSADRPLSGDPADMGKIHAALCDEPKSGPLSEAEWPDNPLKELRPRYQKLWDERIKTMQTISKKQAQAKLDALLDNPLKAWVILQKFQHEWKLTVFNCSERDWTGVVVSIESTAHGGGYEQSFDRVPRGPMGAVGGDCFKFQREEGTRFNFLHMNVRAVKIKCVEGEVEVKPRNDLPPKEFFR